MIVWSVSRNPRRYKFTRLKWCVCGGSNLRHDLITTRSRRVTAIWTTFLTSISFTRILLRSQSGIPISSRLQHAQSRRKASNTVGIGPGPEHTAVTSRQPSRPSPTTGTTPMPTRTSSISALPTGTSNVHLLGSGTCETPAPSSAGTSSIFSRPPAGTFSAPIGFPITTSIVLAHVPLGTYHVYGLPSYWNIYNTFFRTCYGVC